MASSGSSDREERLERVALLVRAGVERWERHVRSLPMAPMPEEHRLALRALVAWYERVCVDDQFVGAPPAAGIEVLSLVQTTHVLPSDDPFVIAESAVRIAEELVNYRKLLCEYRRLAADGRFCDSRVEEHARRQLEDATRSVCEFLDTPC